MNCINHPEVPVASYCQHCGKPLCSECTRPVSGFIYCEQCLAAKVGVPGAQPGAPFPSAPGSGPNPALATLLGIIPGVGAMYNGQFVKAMIHVLVFVILIAITDQHDFFGFFIAAWVLYQIFDANQTAKARRDGLPLPDPFGINELANRLGNQNTTAVIPGVPPGPVAGVPPIAGVPPGGYPPPPPYPSTPYPPPQGTPASSFVGAGYPYPPPPGVAYAPPPPPGTPIPPVPPIPPFADVPPSPEPARRNEPIGAIILIALGLLFLFGTLGIFNFNWIGRGWPLIIIAIGAWMFFKQARRALPPGGEK